MQDARYRCRSRPRDNGGAEAVNDHANTQAAAFASGNEPMNILVMGGDHLRHDAMSWAGNPVVRTPNIDQLAARSVRFSHCFAQSPVCSPARHCMNTGQYCHQHGVIGNGDVPHEGMVTLAHVMKPRGYRCFHVGHMHWQGEIDNGYEPVTGESWIGIGDFWEGLPGWAAERKRAEDQYLIRVTTGGPGPRSSEHFNGHYAAEKTVDFLEAMAESGEKFMAWCCFSEPHPPWYPPREFYEAIDQSKIVLPETPTEALTGAHPFIQERAKIWAHLTEVEWRQIMAAYYGMVGLLDMYVGRVLDSLDRLGLADNTVVLWMTDHGDQLGEHGMMLKFQTREASIRVPLMLSVPGFEPRQRDEFVEQVDIFPTICELTGTAIPDTVSGRSLVPLLSSEPAPPDWRDAVFSQIHEHYGHPDIKMVRTRDWKLNCYDDKPGELFDLRDDANEFQNRIADSDCSEIVEDLQARILAWQES